MPAAFFLAIFSPKLIPAMRKFYSPRQSPCLILIGMPGAGKTTIGQILAKKLNWAFLDTDHMIEALYGARLQDVANRLGKEPFLDVEARLICTLRASRCVIGTGGSVVYRPEAVKHLSELGSLVWLDLSLDTVKKRIADNPERGIAIAPGQTLDDLFVERRNLYASASALTCIVDKSSPDQCAEWIMGNMQHLQAEWK